MSCCVLLVVYRSVLSGGGWLVQLCVDALVAPPPYRYSRDASPWPSFVQRMLNSMQVFLMEVMKVSRLSCAQPMSFTASLVTTLVVFKAVLLCMLVWTLIKERKRLLTSDKVAALHLVAARTGNVTVRGSRRVASPVSRDQARGGGDRRSGAAGAPKLGDVPTLRSSRAARVTADRLTDFAVRQSVGRVARTGAGGVVAPGLSLGAWLRRTNWGQVLKSLFQVLVFACVTGVRCFEPN